MKQIAGGVEIEKFRKKTKLKLLYSIDETEGKKVLVKKFKQFFDKEV